MRFLDQSPSKVKKKENQNHFPLSLENCSKIKLLECSEQFYVNYTENHKHPLHLSVAKPKPFMTWPLALFHDLGT